MNAKATAPFATVVVPKEISEDQVLGLFCCACEDGSAYWAQTNASDSELAEGLVVADFRAGGKMAREDYFPAYQLIPFAEGCTLFITDFSVEEDGEKPKRYPLNREIMQRGLQVMAEKFSRHFNDFLEENDDAITGDVFLQCCVFGDVIYG
jgi:hypothetical protein